WLPEAPDWSKTVTRILTAQGNAKENGAVNYVLAHLGEPIKEDVMGNGRYDMGPVTSRTTRLFLGFRTPCGQCHDHSLSDDWKQQHFWGINAFFRQVDTPGGRPTIMPKKKDKDKDKDFSITENFKLNPKGLVPYERRNALLLYTDATFLDGQKLPPPKGA